MFCYYRAAPTELGALQALCCQQAAPTELGALQALCCQQEAAAKFFCLTCFKNNGSRSGHKNYAVKDLQHMSVSINRNADLQTTAETTRRHHSPDSSGILFLLQGTKPRIRKRYSG